MDHDTPGTLVVPASAPLNVPTATPFLPQELVMAIGAELRPAGATPLHVALPLY